MTDEFYRELGTRLRHARNDSGLSQTTMGEALGVSFQMVQKYERGVSRIPVDKCVVAARVLGVSLLYLITGEV